MQTVHMPSQSVPKPELSKILETTQLPFIQNKAAAAALKQLVTMPSQMVLLATLVDKRQAISSCCGEVDFASTCDLIEINHRGGIAYSPASFPAPGISAASEKK
jgi:hypothetical protein